MPVPVFPTIQRIVTRLSPSERVVFWLVVIVCLTSLLTIAMRANHAYVLTNVPARGGELVEGMVGTPRFLNPLLAVSDADRSLIELVYSGLMRATPEGTLVPALAEDYAISEDGLSYTFTIREDAEFHDGKPVTADDVVFTINLIHEPATKSPKRANWEDIQVEKVDARTVRFILPKPYSPFLTNTTLGILPKHIWNDTDPDEFPFSEYNTTPIGSGPYRVASIKRNNAGVPTLYILKAFSGYLPHRPHLSTIRMHFYTNEEELMDALIDKKVESASGISPENIERLLVATEKIRIERAPLLRIFGVFFNQNQAPVLANQEVRRALNLAVDKEQIVDVILNGYGTAIESPLPPGAPYASPPKTEENTGTSSPSLEKAHALLENAGWEKNENGIYETDGTPLRFALATADTPELKEAAYMVQEMWRSFGADVDVQIFEAGDLNQSVIRPRRYDALLFGEIIGRELDLFAFWHSSQRNDPGLNIALYANIDADAYLEKARTLTDPEERAEQFRGFETEVQTDVPAVFLYAPDFIYALPNKMHGLTFQAVTSTGDRFLNVHEWYTETDNVWPIFAK